jgi:hypothetical protein
MKIRNVYGENVNLTKAQLREYKKVQDNGKVFINRNNRLYRIYQLLRNTGLITVSWSYSNGTEFERW